MKARFLVACLGLLAAGCVLKRSVPPRIFVLHAASPAEAAASGAPVGVLGVQRVSVPGWMDRPEITARTARGEIVPDPLARWGEPVTRGIQRVVAENLAALLPDRHVVVAPFGTSPVGHRVDVAVTEGARQPDGSVLLEARWAVLGPGGAVAVQGRSSHRPAAAAGAEGAVQALSQALASLSAEIAEAVRSLPAAPAE